MREAWKSATGATSRGTRHSCDPDLKLRSNGAVLKTTQASVEKARKALAAPVKPHVARNSREL